MPCMLARSPAVADRDACAQAGVRWRCGAGLERASSGPSEHQGAAVLK